MKKKMWMIRTGALFLLVASLILSFLPLTSHAEESSPGVFLPTVEFHRGETPRYSLGTELGTARNKGDFYLLYRMGLEGLVPNFNIRYTGSDFEELIDELLHDRTGKYFYGTDYVHWVVRRAQFNAGGYVGDGWVAFTMDYHHTALEEIELNGMVEDVLRKMISSGMTDLEKIDAVHDYIVLMTEYGESTSGSPYSAHTIMTEGKGVCQAYATLGYKMLKKLGFDVRISHGKGGNPPEDHAWLKVKLGGEWYNLDMTFDDPVPNRKNTVHYNYALVSDGLMSFDHFEEPGIPFPSATSRKYDDRASRSPRTYTDAEVQAFLNGGDGPEPPIFDEKAYFNALGASEFAMPIEEYRGRDRFRVLFNQPLSSSGMSELFAFVVKGGTVEKLPANVQKIGNEVYLMTNRRLNAGVYYVFVGDGTRAESGNSLRRGWYRKFILK